MSHSPPTSPSPSINDCLGAVSVLMNAPVQKELCPHCGDLSPVGEHEWVELDGTRTLRCTQDTGGPTRAQRHLYFMARFGIVGGDPIRKRAKGYAVR